ncbi:hypothetical protein FAUST_2492 [Fusarium austroamericanum]|uniref:Uncharacterized protein n=1 Tax=Fusarium austroamericanum TaxID=282268 RepID=A0AAN6C6T2_FUSAU|nr:hypothetical protein FAUST_2492 [Fusarium austroamericanum]
MQTTDLPTWFWLPLKGDCEWDSPFNMGNCFDEQYHNVFFILIKALIYLTRFTTFPFVLFFAGMHGEFLATLPMAILSTTTIIPMVLLRLIWAEDYHTHGGLCNPMVEYSVKTWASLSMPNIVSWTPSAAFAVSQSVRIVRETFVSLRIQADSSFDAETLFPTPFAGRDWDLDLSTSGAEAWMRMLVHEDQEERHARREEEKRLAAEQKRLEQAPLLMQKLEDDTNIAIWKAISKRRPQPIIRRQSALTHRQETEMLAEERGLTKKQLLAQRYVVVPVDQSTQSDPSDFADDRAMKTPSDLAGSPVLTQVEPSEPAPTGSSPSSSLSPPSPGVVGVVSSSHVVDKPIFPSEEELPPQAIVPFTEPAGLEPLRQLPSPEQAAGSVASFAQEAPGIPEIPEELLFAAANGSEDGWEESLHQGLFQPAPCISPTWGPTELDAAIDNLLNSGDEVGEQAWDEMAIDDCQVEDVKMEEQGEGEMAIDHAAPAQTLSVPQLPLPQFNRPPPPPQAPVSHFEVTPQTVPAPYVMSQQEQDDLEMEMVVAFDIEMEDAEDEEEVGMGPQDLSQRKILILRAQGSRHNPSQPLPQPTPTKSQSKRSRSSSIDQAAPEPKRAQYQPIQSLSSAPAQPLAVPPVTPQPEGASPAPSNTNKESRLREEEAGKIKAQQEARRNRKPSLFHQTKKPATPGRSAPATPHQQTPNHTSPLPMPHIKDPGLRAAAESAFGTPGSAQKEAGHNILHTIPTYLLDQVAGRAAEDEDDE